VRTYRAAESVSLRQESRDIVEYGHLLKALVVRDLTVRYKRSVLGFFWTMLHPLLLMVIFVMVYSTIFRFAIENYSIYFLSAYLAWNFFSQTTSNAMASIGWNGMLMKQVRAPRSIFPLASTIAGLINLLLAMIPLTAIMLIVGAPIRRGILFVPVSFLIISVFTFGVSLALYSLAVFFVDVRELYTVVVQALLFLTPIIYPLEIVPPRFLIVIKLNPLRYLMELARSPIYYGIVPSMRSISVSIALAAGAFVFGWIVFRKLSPRFYAHL
jgi:ABC-2 type transport system permease protein